MFQGSSPTVAINFSVAEEKPGRSGWSGGLGEELWQLSIRRVGIGNKAGWSTRERRGSGPSNRVDRKPNRPGCHLFDDNWYVRGNALFEQVLGNERWIDPEQRAFQMPSGLLGTYRVRWTDSLRSLEKWPISLTSRHLNCLLRNRIELRAKFFYFGCSVLRHHHCLGGPRTRVLHSVFAFVLSCKRLLGTLIRPSNRVLT